MDLLMGVSYGSWCSITEVIIADGTPAQIRTNPAVLRLIWGVMQHEDA